MWPWKEIPHRWKICRGIKSGCLVVGLHNYCRAIKSTIYVWRSLTCPSQLYSVMDGSFVGAGCKFFVPFIRVVVTLTNPVDGADEEISIPGPRMGLTITPTSPSHSTEISGIAPEHVYTTVLRTLTYQHLNFNPGNPSTMEPR